MLEDDGGNPLAVKAKRTKVVRICLTRIIYEKEGSSVDRNQFLLLPAIPHEHDAALSIGGHFGERTVRRQLIDKANRRLGGYFIDSYRIAFSPCYRRCSQTLDYPNEFRPFTFDLRIVGGC